MISALFSVLASFLRLGLQVFLLRSQPDQYPRLTDRTGQFAQVILIALLIILLLAGGEQISSAMLRTGIIGLVVWWVVRHHGTGKGVAIGALILLHNMFGIAIDRLLHAPVRDPVALGVTALYFVAFFRVIAQKTKESAQ